MTGVRIAGVTKLLLLAMTLAVVGGPASRAAQLSDTIQAVKPAVVGVGTFQPLQSPPTELRGTGFVVGDGRHILTNYHVVAEILDEVNGRFLAAFVGTGPATLVRRLSVVRVDRAHDVALLRMDGSPATALKLSNGGLRPEGSAVAFTGFPIGAVYGLYPVTHQGIISAITPTAIPQRSTRQLDPALIRKLENRFDVYQLDAVAYPGNSGSPLYDPQTGTILGIISSVFVKGSRENLLSEPSGISFAIPIQHARELMDAAGIPSAP